MFSSPSSSSSSSSPAITGRDLDAFVVSNPPDYYHITGQPNAEPSLYDASPAYGTVPSPAYSPRTSEDETFLDGSPAVASSSRPRPPLKLHTFETRSPSMILTINSRQAKTTTSPAFGRGGVIDAELQVNGAVRQGDSLQLIIEGIAACKGTRKGSTTSTRVLYHTQDLRVMSDARTPATNAPKFCPFPFSLPDTAENSEIPLPPSYHFHRPGVEASVRYTLRVIWTKKGLARTNEEINTVFLYLPRSRQSSPLSPSWWSPPSTTSEADLKTPYAYSSRRCVKDWDTIPLTSLWTKAHSSVKLVLPSLLSYEAGSNISAKIIASSPTLAASNHMLDNMHVELIKITAVMVNQKADVHEETLGTAVFGERDGWIPPCNAVEDDMVIRTAHGSVSGGRPQGEMAWRLPGLMQVQYAIRVDLQPSVDIKAPRREHRHTQLIELTTDSGHDLEHDEAWAHAPAVV
ncbi:hypothetical protein FRB95_012344 [Tulasnella sp. JGI-2019a]|nr:hypothetical protein FRB95_012344 [Tulasnella sp. JGI-2019a]